MGNLFPIYETKYTIMESLFLKEDIEISIKYVEWIPIVQKNIRQDLQDLLDRGASGQRVFRPPEAEKNSINPVNPV
jgi:hypothetical protein